jgi:hypothetical protein
MGLIGKPSELDPLCSRDLVGRIAEFRRTQLASEHLDSRMATLALQR